MNKSLIINLLTVSLIFLSYFSPIYSNQMFFIGLFGLSGGLTNWLAIHMLFEKIPFFYGSGVIPNRFNDFKKGIKELIMVEFFSKENINNFLEKNDENNFEEIINQIDEDKIFQKLIEAIEESSLGSMLGMLGGRDALQPLKAPMIGKIKESLKDFKNETDSIDSFLNINNKIEKIIDERLEDLTPNDVKLIIQKIIKKHLGWLVVWGGVIGALIGLFFSINH